MEVLRKCYKFSDRPKFSRRVPDFLSRDRKTPGVKASTGMLQIPQESEVNHFDGITVGTNHVFDLSILLQNVYAIASKGHSEEATGD